MTEQHEFHSDDPESQAIKTAYHDFAQEKLLSFNVMQNVFNANSYTATRILGWSPIFRTAHSYDSRSFIVLD